MQEFLGRPSNMDAFMKELFSDSKTYTPPWYRKTNGSNGPRPRMEIVSGLFIPYLEGHAWLQQAHNLHLPDDHSQDISIMCYLLDDIRKQGYSNRLLLTQAQDTDPAALDLLVITQSACGDFLNTGPAGVEEVLQDDLKDMLKPGEQEEKTHEVLLKKFSK